MKWRNQNGITLVSCARALHQLCEGLEALGGHRKKVFISNIQYKISLRGLLEGEFANEDESDEEFTSDLFTCDSEMMNYSKWIALQ